MAQMVTYTTKTGKKVRMPKALVDRMKVGGKAKGGAAKGKGK